MELEASITRVDAKPAFSLEDGSLHPRLPAGPFEAAWSGHLRIDEDSPIRFGALVRGEVSVRVDGVTVLEGRGEGEDSRVEAGTPLDREPGLYPIEVLYRSPAALPARLQLWWEGEGFLREPLPPWRLFHRPAELPGAAADEDLAARGRTATRRLGCARCHRSAFPGVEEPPPGPSLADLGRRVKLEWLLEWLDDPGKVRAGARMPALFSGDRTGFIERWIIARWIIASRSAADAKDGETGHVKDKEKGEEVHGDHRMGRRVFVSVGCAACHFLPDADRAEQPDLGRMELAGLSDRFPGGSLAAFIADPLARYPDGRMPRLPMASREASDIAAYLLLWSKPHAAVDAAAKEPAGEEMDAVVRRLGAPDLRGAAEALLREKGCAACHPGICDGETGDGATGDRATGDVPLPEAAAGSGCLSGRTLPRFDIDPPTRSALVAYLGMAARERHPSPFEERRRLLERSGCARCHQRDSDRPPPLEEAGSLLGGAWLQLLPFQRAPRLTHVHRKLAREHLVSAVRDGVSGLMPASYSYRMPAFGPAADEIVRALAEADGEPPAREAPIEGIEEARGDPTLGSLAGPGLVGFQGLSCIACHIWKGQAFSSPDPGAVGPDLTRVAGRIRKEWFDRFLEAPDRSHPGTPMPAYFPRGQKAGLRNILGGEPAKQREALWSYLSLGPEAPSPRPPPPLAVEAPPPDAPPTVAQIPLRLSGDVRLEALCVLHGSHDIIVYDIGSGALHGVYTGARLLRRVEGRIRSFSIEGTKLEPGPAAAGRAAAGILAGGGTDKSPPGSPPEGAQSPPGSPHEGAETPAALFRGYERLADGVLVRSTARLASGPVEVRESLRIVQDGGGRRFLREIRAGERVITSSHDLPAPRTPPAPEPSIFTETAKAEGALERPGYRAVAFPRPKTASGEDLLMPGALAVDPGDGRVFVASMTLGEVFVLDDPAGDGKGARFVDYARGLFQEAYSMHAEEGALYILHRRNLTRAVDRDGDGLAEGFERIALLPQGVADDYDYPYGLVRDRTGAFVISLAPHANRHLLGSGGALRIPPEGGAPPRAIAFGMRNPLGWCVGPGGEVFFTDNQGEWVAVNKLCHLVEGRYYGCPNSAQKEHAEKPPGKAAVWVPYAWAKSVNGVAHDGTGGKFGPFAGQLFLAELMFGGAIIRASLEKVNGQYQGACFPFWGKGLLGPLVLAFDPKGRLFVGAITEPGWMAQPDRGALFRIDFTGEVPFEMQTIRVLPRGFRVLFTTSPSSESALAAASYRIERYRYEYTGAYGSPELDRTAVPVERVEASAGGLGVDLFTPALVKDRVYRISAHGVRSRDGQPLVHPVGAYTLNEVPE